MNRPILTALLICFVAGGLPPTSYGESDTGISQASSVTVSLVHGATFAPFEGGATLAPNTFATILGPIPEQGGSMPAQGTGEGGLVPSTMTWDGAFTNGVAPTALDGVSVKINNQNAFVSFIGRAADIGTELDQINFITPDDGARGPVTYEVMVGEEIVASGMVDLGAIAPAFFRFNPAVEDNFLVAALHTDFVPVAPEGFFGEGVASRPAQQGDTLLLFATGFGATDPAVPAGQVAPGDVLSPLVDAPMIMIGELPADVTFAGLAPNLVGLYQFNVTVPQLDDGNASVVAMVGGLSSQADAVIPVQSETTGPSPMGATILAAGELDLSFVNSQQEPGFHQVLTATHNLPSDLGPTTGSMLVIKLWDASRPEVTCSSEHPISGCATVDWSDARERPSVPPGGVFDNSITFELATGVRSFFLSEFGGLNDEPDVLVPNT